MQRPAVKQNRGSCPAEAEGRRVNVVLRNGERSNGSWPADGRVGCRWTLTGHPFDIDRYEVVR